MGCRGLTSSTDPTMTFCWSERFTPAAVLISVCLIPREEKDGVLESAAACAFAVSDGVTEAMVLYCSGTFLRGTVLVSVRQVVDSVRKIDVDLGGMTCLMREIGIDAEVGSSNTIKNICLPG